MGNRLTHGKGGLVQVQRALEQHRQHLGRAAGPDRAGLHHLGQALAVVVVQLFNALVQAGEGFAVGGQGERLRIERAELVDRVQELLERVRLGLLVVHADIGGNARQHHVAADQHLEFVAIQRDVLRRMAVAADAGPRAPAYGQDVTIHHAPVGARHRGYQGREVAAAALDLFNGVRIIQAVLRKERRRRVAAKTGGTLGADTRHRVVGGADPQPHIPALAKPVRQPDVVRVHVGHDHAQDRQAFELIGKNVFPLRLGRVNADAAIHHAPALHLAVGAVYFIAQQPQVDVVQRKR